MNRNTYASEVGRRLRITAKELGYPALKDLAQALGATGKQIQAWHEGRAMVPVKYAKILCQHGVTLDWLYRGDGSALPTSLYIRLHAAMTASASAEVPPYVAVEPPAAHRKGPHRVQTGAAKTRANAA